MAEDSHVEFIDSKEGNQFTVRISRPLTATEAVSNGEKAVSKQGVAVSKEQMLLAFCAEPKSLSEICKHLGLKDRYKVKKRYIDPLLNKSLRMTVNPRLDKYVMNDREKEIVRKALGDKPKERLANAGWMLKAVDAIRNIAVGTKSEVYQIGAESAVRLLVDKGVNLAERIVENVAEVAATTASLFFGYVDAATTISQSCGGGGCNNELPHRKDKKDDLAFARRCHQAAKTMILSSHKRGFIDS